MDELDLMAVVGGDNNNNNAVRILGERIDLLVFLFLLTLVVFLMKVVPKSPMLMAQRCKSQLLCRSIMPTRFIFI